MRDAAGPDRGDDEVRPDEDEVGGPVLKPETGSCDATSTDPATAWVPTAGPTPATRPTRVAIENSTGDRGGELAAHALDDNEGAVRQPERHQSKRAGAPPEIPVSSGAKSKPAKTTST